MVSRHLWLKMSKASKEHELESWDGLWAALNVLTQERGMQARIAREAGVDPRALGGYLHKRIEPRYVTGMKLRRWVMESLKYRDD